MSDLDIPMSRDDDDIRDDWQLLDSVRPLIHIDAIRRLADDVPALLAERDRLRARVAQLEAAVAAPPAPTDPTDHAFLPVNGHPDDDECTYRADGTDDTYCGMTRSEHDGGAGAVVPQQDKPRQTCTCIEGGPPHTLGEYPSCAAEIARRNAIRGRKPRCEHGKTEGHFFIAADYRSEWCLVLLLPRRRPDERRPRRVPLRPHLRRARSRDDGVPGRWV